MKIREILQQQDIIFENINLGRMNLNCDYAMDTHAHNRIEIFLILSGEVEYTFYNDKGKFNEKIFVKSGQFILIDENVIHNIRVLSNNTVGLNIEFSISPAKAASTFNTRSHLTQFQIFNNFCRKTQDYVVATDTEHIKDTITKIHDTYFEIAINPDIAPLNDLLLLVLLVDIARCKQPEKPTTSNFHVNKAIRLLTVNISKNITIDALAAKIGVNKAYLQRIFKEHTGKTIVTYLTELRIKQAKKLLKNESFDIIDVAYEVGFNNRQNFAIAFKRVTGTTPSQYRKMNEKKVYTTY